MQNSDYFYMRDGFKETDLFKTFQNAPLGFVDVGSLDWVHPMSLKIAPIIHALCFELDKAECDKLRDKYAKDSPYAKVTVIQKALDDKAASNTKLYISKHAPNTSLLSPSSGFMERYKAERFIVDRVVEIETETLDTLLFKGAVTDTHMGEFIKIDTQGAEYRIFQGAKQVLQERCLAVWCEVEFFEVYQNQKTYADIDLFLREYGLFLYGFYPHYRSTKSLSPDKYSGEERLMWADALFIKDPFDSRNSGRNFTDREMKALILIGVMCRYYDFALEIVRKLYKDTPQRILIENLIKAEALVDQDALNKQVSDLHTACQKNKEKTYLNTAHFVSRHRSNNSNDYLFPKTLEEG